MESIHINSKCMNLNELKLNLFSKSDENDHKRVNIQLKHVYIYELRSSDVYELIVYEFR